jgi:hypothetical protein
MQVAYLATVQGKGNLIGSFDLIVFDQVGLLAVETGLGLSDIGVGVVDYSKVLPENSSADKQCKNQNSQLFHDPVRYFFYIQSNVTS